MTLLLALALLQDADSQTWSFDLKFDTIKRAARLADNLRKDYDRGRMSWQRTALHAWYAVDRREALRWWSRQMRRLTPETRRRVTEAAGRLWRALTRRD